MPYRLAIPLCYVTLPELHRGRFYGATSYGLWLIQIKENPGSLFAFRDGATCRTRTDGLPARGGVFRPEYVAIIRDFSSFRAAIMEEFYEGERRTRTSYV